jgi:hypothetical protein
MSALALIDCRCNVRDPSHLADDMIKIAHKKSLTGSETSAETLAFEPA